MKNYYDELEVSKTASKDVIEKVYKVLAKKYHPDTTSETDKQFAEEKFKIISEAYEVLSDDEKRKLYDIELEQNNPTISYEDYINVINQRDALNSSLINLQNQLNSYNINPQNQFNQTQYNPNSFNQTGYSNQNSNNYQRPNINQNKTTQNVNNTGKKYYYNKVTGQPISTMDYYKYRIRKFISNIGFYLLLIFVIFLAIKSLFSSDLSGLFS